MNVRFEKYLINCKITSVEEKGKNTIKSLQPHIVAGGTTWSPSLTQSRAKYDGFHHFKTQHLSGNDI